MEDIRITCATVLVCLATIDGNIGSDEVSRIAELYDIVDDELYDILSKVDNLNLADLLLDIAESDEKYDLLKNMVLLCHADGKYDKEEKTAVRNICNLLDIPEEEITKTEKNAAVDITKEKFGNFVKRFEPKGDIKSGVKDIFDKAWIGTKMFGKKISDSGTKVSNSVANGLGALNTRISLAVASAKKTKQENEALRAELKNNALSETVKQSVIKKLNTKITGLKSQLEAEKQRNDENEEIIALLQMQIEDLKQTRELAENTKTA